MSRVDILLQRRDVLISIIRQCKDSQRRAELNRSLRELNDLIAGRTQMTDRLARFAAR